ncbi:ferritin-like domain-containing protein [Catalinimonas sp. 4WD22]|uniref:ferritin-like domain-containing protein n=1 Tax=Catalinimonas locisalis TaxID=3133978 RepID=UPI0031010881
MESEFSNPNLNTETKFGLYNTLLADEYVLYTKTRNAHWYIEHQSFVESTRFIEKQVVSLDIIIDDIAEQVLKTRYAAPISMRKFLKITRLSEWEDEMKSDQIIQELVGDHQKIIKILKGDILLLSETNDIKHQKFLASLVTKHEQIAEMLLARLA